MGAAATLATVAAMMKILGNRMICRWIGQEIFLVGLMSLSEVIVIIRFSKGGISSDLLIMSLTARAARLGETYVAAVFLIRPTLRLNINIMLRLESVAIPRWPWREVVSMGVCDICK